MYHSHLDLGKNAHRRTAHGRAAPGCLKTAVQTRSASTAVVLYPAPTAATEAGLHLGADMLSFDVYELDDRTLELRRSGVVVSLAEWHARVLALLASRSREILTKDALVTCGWADVAVTDNSVEQVISQLRRTLGPQG